MDVDESCLGGKSKEALVPSTSFVKAARTATNKELLLPVARNVNSAAREHKLRHEGEMEGSARIKRKYRYRD